MAAGRYIQPIKSRRSDFVRRASVTVLLISIVLFVLGLNGRQPLEGARRPLESLSAKALTTLSMPLRGLENLSASAKEWTDLALENNRLREELMRLQSVDNDIRALREQVKYLEGVFNTTISIPNRSKRIAARAVSESSGPFVYSALINAGTRKGVVDGDAVLTINGLYGRVVRAGDSSARVLLLTDLNSRIAVMSERNRARAILTGNNSNTPTLEFRGDGEWQIGDRIMTSGDGGVLPRGLPVGVVIQEGANLSADLFTLRAPVDWIWITPFDAIPEPRSVSGPVDALGLSPDALEADPQADTDVPVQTPIPSEVEPETTAIEISEP